VKKEIKKRAVKKPIKKSSKKSPRKSSKRLKYFLFILLLIACTVVLFLPIWETKRVIVEGSHIVSKDLIKQKAAVKLGENIFFADKSVICANVRKIPQIKTVSVSGKLPTSILISVQERKPFAVAVIDGRNIIIDDEGVVLGEMEKIAKIKNIADIGSLPMVTGLSQTSYKNKRINKNIVKDISKVVFEINKSFAGRKASINMEKTEEIEIMLDESLKLKIGDVDDIDKKLGVFNTIMTNLGDKQKSVEYVDLRAINNPAVKFRTNPQT